MKKIIFSFLIAMITLSTYAKVVPASKVPVMVKANFENDYPEAKLIRWESTNGKDFKAEFKIGKSYGTASYDVNGNFIEADQTIDWNDVPLSGRMGVYNLGEDKILNVSKIKNAKNEIFYQVDIKTHSKKSEVILDKEGHIIK